MRIVDLTPTYGSIAYPNRPVDIITDFIIHHSQTRLPSSESDALALIEEIHVYHAKKWPGFAYHRAVWEDVYFLVRPRTKNGWHTGGMDLEPRNGIGDGNDRGVACVLLGNYTNSTPNSRTLQTVAEGKAWDEEQLGRQLVLSGHQDWSATACPSEAWKYWKHSIGAPVVVEPDSCADLRIAIAHMADIVVMDSLLAGQPASEVISNAQAIREQFVGPRP